MRVNLGMQYCLTYQLFSAHGSPLIGHNNVYRKWNAHGSPLIGHNNVYRKWNFCAKTLLCSHWLGRKMSAATWGNLFVFFWAIDEAKAKARNLAQYKRKLQSKDRSEGGCNKTRELFYH